MNITKFRLRIKSKSAKPLPFALLLKAILITFLALHSPAIAAEWRAVDGDSLIKSERGGFEIRARLLCIDAPELYQTGGRAAQRALRRLIAGKIQVKNNGIDRHQRDLVLLYNARGDSINLMLIRQGHAWVSRRHAADCGLLQQQLFAAEKKAKQEKRGLWQQKNPLPPWQWRKQNPRD